MPTLVGRGCARGGLWPVLLCALWMTEVFSVAAPARQGIALLRRYCLFLAYFANIFIKHTMRMTLDRFDRQILDILQTDGRINNQDLACLLYTSDAADE